jgi:glycosyltransferase involved in cell wall biosynthesis
VHIVHVVTRWQRGGAEANIRNQIEFEQRNGDDVTLVVGDGATPDALPVGTTTVVAKHLVRQPSLVHDVGAVAELRRLFATLRPDVVATHFSKPGIVGCAAAPPGAIVVHHVHMPSFGAGYGRTQSALFLRLERACAPRRDLVASVGRELVDIYRRAGALRPDQEAVVVRSPARVEDFVAARPRREAARSALRAELGLPAGARIVAAAGTLEPRKRQRELVSWLRPALAAGDAHLVIAGDGVLREELERLAQEDAETAGRIHLLGYRSNLVDVLAGADVLVHAAATEGVPQVVLQGLATGLPVVATDTVGLREVTAARVAIVDRDGSGLGAAVLAALADPGCPVPAAVLDPWTAPAVESQLADLHERVEALRRAARSVSRPTPRSSPNPPAVAAIVITHERPEACAEAVRSVLAQGDALAEVVVVSDVASPETEAVVEALRAEPTGGGRPRPPVRYVRRDGPAGASASRNAGLLATSAPLVAFLDDDDTWAPGFLDRCVHRLRSTGAGFVATWVRTVGPGWTAEGPRMLEGLGPDQVRVWNPGLTGSNAVYRREVVEAIGGFDESLWVSNDKDLLVRLLEAGTPYSTVADELSLRGIGTGERLGTGIERRVAGLEQYLRKHAEALSAAERRVLEGRIERVRRRGARTAASRLRSTARMVLLLGPRGIRKVRLADEATGAGPTWRVA